MSWRHHNIVASVQDCSISFADAPKILQSVTKPVICTVLYQQEVGEVHLDIADDEKKKLKNQKNKGKYDYCYFFKRWILQNDYI